MSLEIGSRVGRYEIRQKLGSGGMGEVWVAEDSDLGREIALKILLAELATDADRLQRFEAEAKTLATLNHPNIVTIHSVEEIDGLRFITMELIDGQTLAEAIPAGGLGLDRFLELAVPLADGVRAAHQRSVSHRDLKPTNVMITADGRLKILDFGLGLGRTVHRLDGRPDAAQDQHDYGRWEDRRHRLLHVAGTGRRPPRRSP